jgi:uncharacterized hydantoinase/oxoprolinase family protein
MLTEQEIVQIAHFIWERQVDQIADAINQVYAALKPDAKASVPVAVTGLGREFLAQKAAQKAGIQKIINLDELLPKGAALASPAAGVALMAAAKIEGRQPTWTQ